ncbi:MAG: LacI family DNA-binding transcriptional regulator [Oscillospiraceae bacterium]|nr:LacI family DNA-binding transcriptional regulator [Oscillospiraceae bacterium]
MTLKDIAREAGVSAMSVSKAINHKPGISAEKRAHILEIAAQMHYSPNLIAKSLRVNKTKTIGVILSDSSEMVTSIVLRGIQDVAQANGYSVLLANTDHKIEREREAIDTLLSKQIDGLLLVASALHSDADVTALRKLPIPFVFLMRKNDHMNIDSVINDNCLGGYQSILHLAKEGCQRFQLIGLVNSQSSMEREKGYAQAFRDCKIPPDHIFAAHTDPFIQSGYETMNAILAEKRRFDAVVCGCDTVAIGAMESLLEHGLHIPQDVRVIGYDGIYLAKYLRVPLSTVEQPLYQMGSSGMEILLDRIRFPDMAVRKIVLKSELVIRASTHLAE